MKQTAAFWKHELNLLKHPEGGWFKEVYRSSENLPSNCLDHRFNGDRCVSTSIYFLLEQGDLSVFHRIKSDETWHFYDGDPLEIVSIDQDGKINKQILGLDPRKKSWPQLTIPFGNWFAAQPLGLFTLVGCTVAPGFNFLDFEMASRRELSLTFPNHKQLIDHFTR